MPDEHRSLKYYTLFGFFVIGIITVLLGQVLPILSSRLHLNDAESGRLLVAQFSGSLLGTLFATRIARHLGFVMTTVIGVAMMIVGLPGLNFDSFALCWIAVFIYGSGLGLTIPAVNLLTIEITPVERQSASINLINFAWGIGAILSYPFVVSVSHDDSLVIVTATLVIALIVLAICFASVRKTVTQHPSVSLPEDLDTGIWSKPSPWLFVIFGFFVIGIESSMGGWLTTYSNTFDAASRYINLTVVYYAFLIFGRGLASIISSRLTENKLISICSIALLTGISLLVFLPSNFSVLGAAVAGLGSSAIFPTNMVRFTKVFGAHATRNATPVFIAGTCGSAFVSWLIGVISTDYGGLRFGIAVLLIAGILVLLIQILIVMVFRPAFASRSPRT